MFLEHLKNFVGNIKNAKVVDMLFHTSLTTNSLLLFKDIKSGLSVQELLEILIFFDKWSSFFEAKIDVIQISFTLSNNHNLNQISSIFEKKYSENSLNETHSSYFCVTRKHRALDESARHFLESLKKHFSQTCFTDWNSSF